MTAVYVQKGDSIDYIPSADVDAGDVVVIGNLVGIAKLDIAANTLGALALCGVFDVPKASGEGTAITAGSIVFWNATAKQATVSFGNNKYLGKTILDAADGDETARVILNISRDVPITPEAAITDPDAAANDLDDQSGGTANVDHQLGAVGDTSTADQSGVLNNNFATIGAEYNALKDDVEANNSKLDAVLAALRSLGFIAT